ncbi:MAG: hypothetical protein A3G93_04825 [Nitrospinae bacterium RIFCSPLOWO2_12_FULL_45_22]|nr:MAG: hypothetical protein A3G93_04825 [Nitrospinae bacterium RIFCSPLOWO2_12_FULL_45_22]
MIQDNEIIKLYRQGKGQREIARQLGISQPAVRKRLIKLGLLQGHNQEMITSTSIQDDNPLSARIANIEGLGDTSDNQVNNSNFALLDEAIIALQKLLSK